MQEIHSIPPVYDENSRILILGSFPSVKSRETCFFYGHPQNRFWQVTAAVFNAVVPVTMQEKKCFLLENGIALWDVIASCEIVGSADSSIKNVVPNDLQPLLAACSIRRVFTNGKTAEMLYKKYMLPITKLPAISLPSTSPANAAWSTEALINRWKSIDE